MDASIGTSAASNTRTVSGGLRFAFSSAVAEVVREMAAVEMAVVQVVREMAVEEVVREMAAMEMAVEIR